MIGSGGDGGFVVIMAGRCFDAKTFLAFFEPFSNLYSCLPEPGV